MWNLSSRVHPLNNFPNYECACYVKRDDELSCGISGSKLRKYASLIPFLNQKGIRHLIIIAGPQSNNLLAAVQIAREVQLEITAFLIKPRSLVIQGNYKLTRLFMTDSEIIWVERKDWPQVKEMAECYFKQLEVPAFILYEGASVIEAIEGSMTLADDIVRNEKELEISFQHIFVDAGTGFTAAALIKRLAQLNHRALVHILLLADNEALFHKNLMKWIELSPGNYDCFYPTTAKSFGSINHTIKQEIRRLAREEGVLADPIYSAKLFYEARRYIEIEKIKGNILIIHSGGALTLAGFDW